MKKRFIVEYTTQVAVELDTDKFTEEFMEEFREGFFPFHEISEHAEHLGQLYIRGIIDTPRDFIEGYGPLNEMNIVVKDYAEPIIEVLAEQSISA